MIPSRDSFDVFVSYSAGRGHVRRWAERLSCCEDIRAGLRTGVCDLEHVHRFMEAEADDLSLILKDTETKSKKKISQKTRKIKTLPWSTFVSTWKAHTTVLHINRLADPPPKKGFNILNKSVKKKNERRNGWQERGSPALLVVNSCPCAEIKPK